MAESPVEGKTSRLEGHFHLAMQSDSASLYDFAHKQASFKKQLSDILEDVTSEEKVTRKLRQQLRAARAR